MSPLPQIACKIKLSLSCTIRSSKLGIPTTADLPFEFMMNALRLNAGFDCGLYLERTGLDLVRLEVTLAQAEAEGLLERTPGWIRPSTRGRRYLNELLARFLP